MSYAVLHIIKANSSLNSIAKHIERTSHPDNADPERTHLNRYGLVEYPDGITGLCGGCRTPHSQCRDNPENLRPAGTLPHTLGNFRAALSATTLKISPICQRVTSL